MSIENNISQKKKESVLEEEDFQEMIEFRKIKDEDLEIIEKLSHFPKKLFSSYHNFFNFSKENTLRDLERNLRNNQDDLEKAKNYGDTEDINSLEEKIAFLNLFIEFTKKYDWCISNNLNRVFERRKIKK